MNKTFSISNITMKLFGFEVCPINVLNRQSVLPVLFVSSIVDFSFYSTDLYSDKGLNM